MRKLIQKLKEIWSIEELREKIINTLVLLLIYRLGTFIIIPGINAPLLREIIESNKMEGLLGLINTFSGGAFERGSIFALGIMPYISASIVIQLLTIAVPYFQKLSKEGEDGRQRMNQITRYLTIAITAVQGFAYLSTFGSDDKLAAMIYYTNPELMSKGLFTLIAVVTLVTGTMFTMWLGERITDRGLGNGISLIIMVGIISRLPFSLSAEFGTKLTSGGGPVIFLVEMVIWLAVILSVVLLIQGVRKIPVQYAKRVVGRKQYGGVRQYLPLKVNAAGVMPIIFAQALMFLPATLGQLFENNANVQRIIYQFANPYSWGYNIVFFIMIVLFTYFYTAITINPRQIAEDLKRNGGFIPGIKPGNKTANFIDAVMSRITLPGALYLAFVSIFPAIAQRMGVNNEFAQFFGGTSLLILVGVVLDTLQQMEQHLIVRRYDGFMKSGRLRGKSAGGVAI